MLLYRPLLLLSALASLAAMLPSPARAGEFKRVDIWSDFDVFDPGYSAKISAFYKRLKPLNERVMTLEAAGEPLVCAHQVLTEVRWRMGSTADYAGIEAGLDRLTQLLAKPEEDRIPDTQDPADGSWGRCYTEWFFKVVATYNAIEDLIAARKAPERPIHLFDRINDPQRLRAYFLSVAVSDIAQNGVNHLRELNENMSNLMRLILHDQPVGYPWHPGLKDEMMSILLGPLRDPATGYWGETYKHDGKLLRVQDLSVTFHVVRYLGGHVPDLPLMIDTTLAIKDLPFSQGWLRRGSYMNHHSYDVVALFRLGWPEASESQRQAMRTEIAKMLDWCLTKSVSPDGTVAVVDSDSSVEEAYYYAISFLDEVGYFTRAQRFWTDQDFPEGPALAAKLKARVTAALAGGAGGAGGTYYRSALWKLGG